MQSGNIRAHAGGLPALPALPWGSAGCQEPLQAGAGLGRHCLCACRLLQPERAWPHKAAVKTQLNARRKPALNTLQFQYVQKEDSWYS